MLESQIGDADVTLDSFIISVTPFGQIGLWDKRLTQKDFEKKHVLFQDGSGAYICNLFKRQMIIKER